MDVSGEVADLMVKESIQLTEASIKLLAAGSKNLSAFLYALAKDNKKLVGKTHMARLLKEGKELKVFHIKEDDLKEFRAFAKKNVLFAAVKSNNATDGMVDLITNTDFSAQVNLFMERRGYPIPARDQEAGTPKKAAPRAQPDSYLPQRGNGLTPKRTENTETITVRQTSKPSVKAQLDAFRVASQGLKGAPSKTKDHTPPQVR